MGSPATVLLGVDRLDYTKGIDIRLKAFAEVWDERLDPATTIFVQVAVPSRETFRNTSKSATISKCSWEDSRILSHLRCDSIYYLRAFSNEELIALYLATDIMLVTPLRDGMNLVAKVRRVPQR